jgi:hypothetical protein
MQAICCRGADDGESKVYSKVSVVTARHTILRLISGGLIAGCVINACEYGVHRLLLDAQWTAAFAALSKTPTGWTTFIPSNFLVGTVGIWVYGRMLPHYGSGWKTAFRAALLIWIVFWAIPMMGLQPLNLFPDQLLFTAIAAGFLDCIPAILLGACVYERRKYQ